jgi:transcriptional regulator with XRE-family HTH domain
MMTDTTLGDDYPKQQGAVKMGDSIKRHRAIAARLHDPDYRKAFVGRFAVDGIAFQLRAMRQRRGWSLDEMSRRSGMSKGWLQKLETGDDARLSLRTFLRLAAAFDVAVIARFVSFGDLLDAFCAERAEIPAFDDDPRINGACAREQAGE